MIMNKEQETKFRELISQRWNHREELQHTTFFKTLFEVMDFPVAEYIDYEGCYQGDYLIFIRWYPEEKCDTFLLGKFGYGSCSGCDSIYMATTIDEIVKLANDLLFNLKEINYYTFNILLDLLGVKRSN